MNVQCTRSFDSQNRMTFCTPGREKLPWFMMNLSPTGWTAMAQMLNGASRITGPTSLQCTPSGEVASQALRKLESSPGSCMYMLYR